MLGVEAAAPIPSEQQRGAPGAGGGEGEVPLQVPHHTYNLQHGQGVWLRGNLTSAADLCIYILFEHFLLLCEGNSSHNKSGVLGLQ